MSGSVKLLASSLDDSQLQALVLDLASQLHTKPQNLTIICEIVSDSHLDLGLDSAVAASIWLYIDDIYSSDNTSDILSAIELLKVIPSFQSRIIEKIELDLCSFLVGSKSQFLPQIAKQFSYLISSESYIQLDSIQNRISFLEKLFIACKDSQHQSYKSLDKLLYSFLAINEDEVLAAVTRVLRWRVQHILQDGDFDHVWNTIFEVAANGLTNQLTAAFTLWIRSVDYISQVQGSDTHFFQKYQSVLLGAEYWKLLQLGLSSLSPEHRRISLSILQYSVKLIDSSFKNEIMLWDQASHKTYLEEWQRFVTLYEVVAIDTSLHQAQAGSGAIVDLISPKSNVHSSWGLCLLSTGFKATMDSVRKFALNLTLSLPHENMLLLKFGPEFLKLTFLPYAMLATHFVVRNEAGDESCPYGERFAAFITSMVKSFKSEQDLHQVCGIILEVLQSHKEAFDPARIYLGFGLLQGLKGPTLTYEKHIEPLIELFECNCEGDVFECTSQTIYLHLLLKFKLTSLKQFVSSVDKFVKFNGVRVLNKEMPHIIDYLKKCSLQEEDFVSLLELNIQTDERVLTFSLADLYCEGSWPRLEIFLSKQDDLFLSSLLASNFKIPSLALKPEISKLFESMISRAEKSRDHLLIDKLSVVESHRLAVLSTPSSIKSLFDFLESEVTSQNHSVLTGLLNTFRFLNKIIQGGEWPSFLTTEILYQLKGNLFVNSQEATKQDTNFYKLKDQVEGLFIDLLCLFVGQKDLPEPDLLSLLDLVEGSTNLARNLSVCSFVETCLSKNYTEQLIEELSKKLADVWSELDSSRLQLNQKALQVSVLRNMFSSKMLFAAKSNSTISSRIHEVALSVIANAPGRRTILPVLTECLYAFKVADTKSFESLPFIHEILVLSFTVYQIRYNVFKLESVIGGFFDTNFNFDNGGLYAQTYGAPEISARVNVLATLATSCSPEFCSNVIEYILSHEDTLHLFKPIKATDGTEEWTRIQLMTIVVAMIENSLFESESTVKIFMDMLGKEPSPLVRVYIEWILALSLKNYKVIFDGFSSINESSGNLPVLFTAYERIVFLLSQKLDAEEQSKLLAQLLPHVIIGSTSNKALIRHFSLSLMCSIYSEVKNKNLNIPEDINTLVSEVYVSAVKSEAYGKYRNGDALLWDIKQDLSLVGLLGGVLLKVSDRQVDSVSESVIKANMSSEQILSLSIPVGSDQKQLWISERKHQDSKRDLGHSSIFQEVEGQSPLQTKSGAWNGTIDLKDEKAVKRSDLIVVSSLVDKAPNLGGICRLCDVLGAGLLTLADIRVKNSPHFKNVAVTADRWMPMEEVPVDQIKNYMVQKKSEGYTLVGLEQTDKSLELNSELKFPKKTLMLLGREKEGIPGDLLAELDFCVEIKQVGVIRSMNIQTATAVIVHAYSTQHC